MFWNILVSGYLLNKLERDSKLVSTIQLFREKTSLQAMSYATSVSFVPGYLTQVCK